MIFQAGEVVAGYQVECLLGQGSMGTVYRARAQDGQAVALKLMGQEGSRQRFQSEAEALSQIRCPGIPRIYGFAMEPIAYLAEEILEGPSLEQRLAQGPLSVAQALAIADSLLRVLQVIHEHGFVHRDLSPYNILLR